MSVADLANSIKKTLVAIVSSLGKPAQRKLAEACAAMIHTQSVNTSKICDALPHAPSNRHEREQWLFRLLKTDSFSEHQAIEPFARKELERACLNGQRPILCMDQTDLGEKHAILMLALRIGERAIPLVWHVEKGEANIGSCEQIKLLEKVMKWFPEGAQPILMGDRFYPSISLFQWLRVHNFSWRVRLKGSIDLACSDIKVNKVSDLSQRYKHQTFFDSKALLFNAEFPCSIGWIWDEDHAEGWAICMDCKATRATTLDYGCRWSIEPMFSDFKSRGFNLQTTQIRIPQRLSKMVLLVALAIRICIAVGDESVKKTLHEVQTTNSDECA